MKKRHKTILEQLKEYYKRYPADDILVAECREKWALPIEPHLAMDLTIDQSRVSDYLKTRARNDNAA